MTSNSSTETSATSPQVSSTDLAIAVLTERVGQVIGDHERRISTLETINTQRPTKGAALIAPFIAAGALVILVADKVSWE